MVLDWENSGPGDVNGAGWVAEYLNEPVTVDTLDRVLSAVNG